MKKWVVWIAFLLALFCIITLVDESMRRQRENIPRTSWGVGENVPTANPAVKDGKWDVIRLGEVQRWKYPTPPEGVYMTLTRVKEDAVVAAMHNDTEESWGYGYGYTLQVKLEDKWYFVPEVPGKSRNYVLIGFSLDPGDVLEETYGLGWWGNLPKGTYRLMKEINQGTIPNNNFVQRYLTVEFEIP